MQDIPRYYEPVLQALTHWIAYKREYFYEHLLPEGAIVAELTQLLSAKLPSGFQVKCETLYKDMDPTVEKLIRADITISECVDGCLELRDVIEVKRYDSAADFDKVIKDADKLSILREALPHVSLLQVVAGQRRAPDKLVTDAHNVVRNNIYPKLKGIERLDVRARICKKAYGTKRPSASGAFAVLLEVSP